MKVIEKARTSEAIESALRTIGTEREALELLQRALQRPGLREGFEAAVAAIARQQGRLLVPGRGKSGIMARKVAATMTSTGTPAQFLHPAEASHGDLGAIASGDTVLAITWSGETTELGDIIGHSRRFGNTLIVVTANPASTAGRAADICLALPEVQEACPNDLAPTSSTTVQVVLGDALAIALVERRGFSRSDFLTFHPGGRLGAKLTSVERLMGVGEAIPAVGLRATIRDAAIEMSRKRYGGTAVVGERGELAGAFTDGDLRRSFAADTLDEGVALHMSRHPITVTRDALTSDALRIMNQNAITLLFVCEGRRLVGALHLHDLLRSGAA